MQWDWQCRRVASVINLPHACRSVKRFADKYKSKGFPIHGLINNAGIFLVKPETTADGFEVWAVLRQERGSDSVLSITSRLIHLM